MLLKHLFREKYPNLDWIQVEVSSYCNAGCIYCPQTAYKQNWRNRYLSMEAFTSLVPAFATTKLVYLQGWGEPFTHPQFSEMVRLAKQAGCLVGTTSNGTLLNRDTIARLIDDGLDIIGFSLAGVDEKNDCIRFHIVSPVRDQFSCSENVPRAVVVGSDGSISPCVMKQIPVKGENYFYVNGRKHLLQNLTFGDIRQESLKTIWHKKDYQHFTQKIHRNKMPSACQNCLKGHSDNLIQN